MTREEAIKILEDGEWWDNINEFYEMVNPEFQKLHDSVDVALSALRSQQEAENEPLTGWISVKDRLPEKGNEDWYNIVLTKERSGDLPMRRIVKVGYWDWYHKRFWGFEVGYGYTVTHWMPLPEPPKEGAHA
ncbi:DUF551 domain-containing protein [uncultured Dysosmobacter sp.]|uniref:DUF551 domain-containing protein n=1 Tax=uncultured Dysosmobacter sp. TaxID=2591384 RepID=UPI002626BE7C|nr:DUF551 domain-containing protein [uncultured Dysosmobacter sp.]